MPLLKLYRAVWTQFNKGESLDASSELTKAKSLDEIADITGINIVKSVTGDTVGVIQDATTDPVSVDEESGSLGVSVSSEIRYMIKHLDISWNLESSGVDLNRITEEEVEQGKIYYKL